MTIPVEIFTSIAIAQALLLVATVAVSAFNPTPVRIAGWISTAASLAAIGAFACVAMGYAFLSAGTSLDAVATYVLASIGIVGLQWGARSIERVRSRAHDARLERPVVRQRAADELREVLRNEGVVLDDRLRQAEQEREQFLYALEERHARQIAGLAQEYQHEAQAILRQLLDQLAAQTLQPLVEQRLAEHAKEIESELGAIDSAAAGETLNHVRTDLIDLTAQIDAAEKRIATLVDQNPDRTIEDRVADRLNAIDTQIEERMSDVLNSFELTLGRRTTEVEARITDVGRMLDDKVDAASHPLSKRMADVERRVEQRLGQWNDVLDRRFIENERILNDRVLDQEKALESRVLDVEHSIDARLAAHAETVEHMLATHDRQLNEALDEQGVAVINHAAAERDRITAELSEHADVMQQHIAAELERIEVQARDAVQGAQRDWNTFTEDLEERFAVTREEAIRAAKEIAQAERDELQRELETITHEASGDIARRVEALGKEAAWQRAQVERIAYESMDLLQGAAQDAVDNADHIFGDLERIGNERVERIRRQAEDALVQSRDYVGQLQDSLGVHLEQLRERSGDLAADMNDRLSSIAESGRQTAEQLEAHARNVVSAATSQIANVGDAKLREMSDRLTNDVVTGINTSLDAQQRQYESHVREIAQRAVQQVQGDLVGLAEQARGAVTGELEQLIERARVEAQRAQEQAHAQLMSELARQQQELNSLTHEAVDGSRQQLEEWMRGSRRMLDEAMATMGAHMREELVRFGDEGQRRVQSTIEQLRASEHEMLRDEDRKLSAARGELMRRHQSALEDQVKTVVGGLSGSLGTALEPGIASAMSFTADVSRPATPMASEAPSLKLPSFGGEVRQSGGSIFG